MAAEDFTGEDGFSYTVSDGYSTATGWVTMNVVADDTFQAVDDAYTTQENQVLNAGSGQTQPSILSNDLAASPPTIIFINGTPLTTALMPTTITLANRFPWTAGR